MLSIDIVKHNIDVFKKIKDYEKLSVGQDGKVSVDDRYWQSLRRATDGLLGADQESSRLATYNIIKNTYSSLDNNEQYVKDNRDLIIRSLNNLSTTQIVTYPDYGMLMTLIGRFQNKFKPQLPPSPPSGGDLDHVSDQEQETPVDEDVSDVQDVHEEDSHSHSQDSHDSHESHEQDSHEQEVSEGSTNLPDEVTFEEDSYEEDIEPEDQPEIEAEDQLVEDSDLHVEEHNVVPSISESFEPNDRIKLLSPAELQSDEGDIYKNGGNTVELDDDLNVIQVDPLANEPNDLNVVRNFKKRGRGKKRRVVESVTIHDTTDRGGSNSSEDLVRVEEAEKKNDCLSRFWDCFRMCIPSNRRSYSKKKNKK
jgi:hypothetical protein